MRKLKGIDDAERKHKNRKVRVSDFSALSCLLDKSYIRFGTKLYRQIVGILMGTNCTPLIADLLLYCYERDFTDSLNHDNQCEAFKSTSGYMYHDDLLNSGNPYFEGMVNQIYQPEFHS